MRNVALTVLAALVFSFVALLCPATAAETKEVPFTGVWRGGAYTDDTTGKFSHCAASAPYRSGIALYVAVNREFGWTLGFQNSEWHLHIGEYIPVSISFGGGNAWNGSAQVVVETFAVVPMADDSTLIKAFRGAYMMQIQAARQTFAFNLDGTSRLILQLVQCVQTQLAVEHGTPPPHLAEAPPRQLNPPAPSVTTTIAPNTEFELTATRIASNLLLQGGLPNAHLLSLKEMPTTLRGRGAAWISDAGLGAVELVPGAVGKEPNQIVSELIANDGGGCKGDFASGRSSELMDDKVITKAFTGCKDSAGTQANRYFVLHAADGNFIIYELVDKGDASSPAPDSPMSNARFQAAAVRAAFAP